MVGRPPGGPSHTAFHPQLTPNAHLRPGTDARSRLRRTPADSISSRPPTWDPCAPRCTAAIPFEPETRDPRPESPRPESPVLPLGLDATGPAEQLHNGPDADDCPGVSPQMSTGARECGISLPQNIRGRQRRVAAKGGFCSNLQFRQYCCTTPTDHGLFSAQDGFGGNPPPGALARPNSMAGIRMASGRRQVVVALSRTIAWTPRRPNRGDKHFRQPDIHHSTAASATYALRVARGRAKRGFCSGHPTERKPSRRQCGRRGDQTVPGSDPMPGCRPKSTTYQLAENCSLRGPACPHKLSSTSAVRRSA